jgi:pyruvate dehydrogenase E1 component alpha subunit
VYETFNMASLWKLPVIFVIENNQYAMGTAQKRSTSTDDIHTRGAPFGIPGEMVDGMDVLAVKEAGQKAVGHCRDGKGPFILEIKTYRYRGHSMSDPAKYRTREEVQKMREERDPIEAVRKMLLDGKHASEDDLKAIDKEIKDVVNESAEFAKDSPEPDLDELWTDIYAKEIPQGEPA